MDPQIFDHLLVLVLVVVVPLRGVRAWRTLRRALEEGRPDARIRTYRRSITFLWGLTAVLLAAWAVLDRSWASLGLAPPSGLVSWGLLAAAVALAAYQLLAVRALSRRPEELEAVIARAEHLTPLLPADEREMRWFAGVGLTAGVTEELLYRGFLIAWLSVWVGLWPAVLLSSVAFGVGHVYQGGVRSAMQTGTAGLVFATVYALAGQLWAPMILHAAVDLGSGWAAYQALRARAGEERGEGTPGGGTPGREPTRYEDDGASGREGPRGASGRGSG